MTTPASSDDRRAQLRHLLHSWSQRYSQHRYDRPRGGAPGGSDDIVVASVEVLRRDQPKLWGVAAEIQGRPAHAVLSLCSRGTSIKPLRGGDDPVLGTLEDDSETLVVADALSDAKLAALALHLVMGGAEVAQHAVLISNDWRGVEICFDERWRLTAFPWPFEGEHPGVALLIGLDEAGFNHLPAPIAVWRHGGRDLGVVQEVIVGSAPGDAVALGSLRDLYAAALPPQHAGGDFATEAEALGTMAARMHLALAEAFGRQMAEVLLDPSTGSGTDPSTGPETVADARPRARVPVLRTHGDFTLWRTARSDQGWMLADYLPGGCVPGTAEPVFRTPLADVGDMVRSFGQVARGAAEVRDPTGRLGAAALGRAWQERNAAAFLRGYRETPGIHQLLPDDPDVTNRLVARFSTERPAEVPGAV